MIVRKVHYWYTKLYYFKRARHWRLVVSNRGSKILRQCSKELLPEIDALTTVPESAQSMVVSPSKPQKERQTEGVGLTS